MYMYYTFIFIRSWYLVHIRWCLGLLPTPCLVLTSGWTLGLYGLPGIKLMHATCKVTVLLTVLSLQPQSFIFEIIFTNSTLDSRGHFLEYLPNWADSIIWRPEDVVSGVSRSIPAGAWGEPCCVKDQTVCAQDIYAIFSAQKRFTLRNSLMIREADKGKDGDGSPG